MNRPSSKKIEDCHILIRQAFPFVLNKFKELNPNCDLKVDYTYRSPEDQLELFKKGRIFKNEQWVVVNPKLIVTQDDGTIKKSHHNVYPSQAADIYIVRNGGLLFGQSEDEMELYKQLGELWGNQNLISGAIWKFQWKDPAHVQVAYPIV